MIAFLCLLFVQVIRADYDCLCTYSIETNIYSTKSTNESPIGYLYEFDCKPYIADKSGPGDWMAIAFQHQLGYVQSDANTNVQTCGGRIPAEDKLTTTPQPATTTSKPTTTTPQPSTTTPTQPSMTTTQTTTTQPTTTTPQPTTTTFQRPTTTTPQPTKSTSQPTTTSTLQPTTSTSQPTTTTPQPTTSTPQPTTTTPQPTTTLQPTTSTSQPTTRTSQPTTSTPQPTTSTPQPTTLTPQLTTTSPQPTTTTPQPTTSTPEPTTTTPQPTTSTPQPTTSTPQPTTTTPQPTTTTPQPTTSTPQPTIAYGTYTCPRSVLYSTINHQSYVSNSEQKCYELVNLPKHSWSYAEKDCETRGGHLVTINNINEKTFINTFLKNYGNSVWIGLHQNVGQFTWISGESLTYEYWSTYANKSNNCVVMDSDSGTWNTASCQAFYGYICEYDAVATGSSLPLSTTTHRPTTTTVISTTSSYHGTYTCPRSVVYSTTNHKAYVSNSQQKCYELVYSPKHSWSYAEADCQTRGGHLVTINSVNEKTMIQTVLKEYGYDVWIGLQQNNDHFSWTSGESLTYEYWSTYANKTNNCVVMDPDTGTWNTVNCQSFYGYICEYDAVATGSSLPPSTTTTNRPSTTPYQQGERVCPYSVVLASSRENAVVIHDPSHHKCYEFVKSPATDWVSAEHDCVNKGGHLATIQDSSEESILYSYVHNNNLPAWIGLNDRGSEGYYHWTSGKQMTYQHWHSSSNNPYNRGSADCVAIGTIDGTWNDLYCSSKLSYFCEFETVLKQATTTPVPSSIHITQGNTHLCPSHVYTEARTHNFIHLGQYGNWCYEFVEDSYTWGESENECRRRGGYLAYIQNQEEQNYILTLIRKYNPNVAVWIGLNDLNNEGQFQWSSGARVDYTNFLPSHTNHYAPSSAEDCVALVPFQSGKWDDVTCGSRNVFFGTTGHVLFSLCQYRISSTSSQLIG